jgi:thiosulfate/3-mercaptopyruvate sulfurtransferase
MTNRPLIKADELAKHIGDTLWFVADCRHELSDPAAGERSFLQGHIPGARHVHLDRDLSRPPGDADGRHPLPDPAEFRETLQHMGISEDAKVVAYDDCGGAMAARFWWMLRWVGHEDVAVLDGGIPVWVAKGLPLETDTQDRLRTTLTARAVQSNWVVSTEALLNQPRDIGVLLDARTGERFAGTVEPIDPVAGHVPGAVNLPFEQLLTAERTFRLPADLRAQFERVLRGRRADEVITMCGSGVTACHLLLGMAAAGLEPGRLYAGSWSEWIRDHDRPVATGA